MVPVNCCAHAAEPVRTTATSSAMLLPRGILNSHSRAVVHEIFSAATAAQLEQLGNCHEGPATSYKGEHGEARPAQHPQGAGKRGSGAPGQTQRGTERYWVFRAKSTGQKIGINYFWILDPRPRKRNNLRYALSKNPHNSPDSIRRL